MKPAGSYLLCGEQWASWCPPVLTLPRVDLGVTVREDFTLGQISNMGKNIVHNKHHSVEVPKLQFLGKATCLF